MKTEQLLPASSGVEMPKAYQPQQHESAIYKKWEDSGFFNPDNLPGRRKKVFSIAMPPTNVTGTMHIGHGLVMTIEDIMVRYARMRGDKTLWLPGLDHAAIATQNVVERELKKKGQTRHDLGRAAFLKEIDIFIARSKDRIRRQTKALGASCNWSRERYTMDPGMTKAVQRMFIKMHNDGLIYRGERIVNWCPRCQSTLADDEVEYRERQTPFYYFKYGPVVIGTARPETKFCDKIIIVHPDDKRYQKLHGREFDVEWIDGKIKARVIADKAADPEEGSGAMTITPGHSFTDFELAKKYNLPIESIIDEEGKLTTAAGKLKGLPARQARTKIVEILQKKGLVDHIDNDYVHNLSVCYRCDTPIEPLVSKQWFIDVNKPVIKQGTRKLSLKEKAIAVVKFGEINIIPKHFSKVYFHWMNNLHDWNISRQIWFGHRIPIWYKNLAKPVEITYFVHGTTEDNEKNRGSGQHDTPLSKLGIEQSHELKGALKNKKFNAIYTSDLKRAVATAEIVFGQNIIKDKRLRECDYGELTLAANSRIENNELKYITEPFPDGESYQEVGIRMQDFLSEIADKYAGKKIAIVAHKAPQLALDVLLGGKSWQEAIGSDWRKQKAWQPGWSYLLKTVQKVSADKPAGTGWRQDPDVLDTWFSSSLWTFSTLGWPDKTKDLKAFHPTTVLETGYDILFFWVARMILMTTYAMDEIPFKTVYLHGLVRDRQGRKMSKSLGNGIDPLEMSDKYSADAVRLSLVAGTTPGNDMRLYEEKIAAYRNFGNKLWNIARYARLTQDLIKAKRLNIKTLKTEEKAILHKANELIRSVTAAMDKYSYGTTGEAIYNFVWHEFADIYLEESKARPTANTSAVISYALKTSLKLLHPFMPFITEHVWEKLGEKNLLMIADWPRPEKWDFTKANREHQQITELIAKIRNIRALLKMPAGDKIDLSLSSAKHQRLLNEFRPIIMQLVRANNLELGKSKIRTLGVASGISFGWLVANSTKEYLKKDADKLTKYVNSLKTKLADKNFIDKAPAEIIEQEKFKLINERNKLAVINKIINN
ncbi:MAG: class I tRNA ligase family protein [Patescibacteria group bacterium]